MATKRGLCPYCKINNIQHSIFLVNPEASSVYCGTNMHQISPQEAIKNYERYMQGLIKKADDTLNVVCNPALAYQEYADVIEIDNSYVRPYLGRLLCLVYMSKVRKNHLHEAKLLLEVGTEETFTKVSDFPVIFNALRNIVKVTEEYLGALKKKLTFRQYFYDTDCLALYFTHIVEAEEFENAVFDAVNSLKKKDNSEKYSSFLNYMDEKISEKEKILKDTEFVLVNGKTYKFDKCNTFKGVSTLTEVKKKKLVDTKTSLYRMATLDIENKNLRYINDIIFKDYTKTITAKKHATAWFIVFYVLSLASGISIYFAKANFTAFVICILVTAIFFVLGVIFMSLVIYWSVLINKKRRKLEIY